MALKRSKVQRKGPGRGGERWSEIEVARIKTEEKEVIFVPLV